MLRPLFFAFAFAFFTQAASAVTLHIDMTPELAGDKGVTMKPLDGNMTRFTIRISTKGDPEAIDPRFPFVRRGSLDVRGEQGRILRCVLQPTEKGVSCSTHSTWKTNKQRVHGLCWWSILMTDRSAAAKCFRTDSSILLIPTTVQKNSCETSAL